jgi:hypothetical protein
MSRGRYSLVSFSLRATGMADDFAAAFAAALGAR